MNPHHPRRSWYLPGLTYDLAFARVFRGLRRRVARIVERDGLFPWLDVCSGTGAQLRRPTHGHAMGRARGKGSPLRIPIPDLDPLNWPVSDREIGRGRERHEGNLVIGLDIHFGFVRYAAARSPGVPFVCGDAARLPFKEGSVRAVSISFGLHDKSQELRRAIIQETRRALGPNGMLIAVDFERPWNVRSRAGALIAQAIERLAPREHYRNGREFLRNGGLRALFHASGFVEVERRDIEAGSLAIVVARPAP